jgi:glycosyltransferase involved in cell wall biosynthesis
MIDDVLEIFIFTYNRADFLARTLGQFASSPFRNCTITVLDNHSTDHTSAVCERFKLKLPRIHHVRHPKNIGGLANYLRAIELATGEYTWVICDDDIYDFSNVSDVVEGVLSRELNVISVGVEGHELPGGYFGAIRDFALLHPYFLSHSFVPAMIFRTGLFDSTLIRRGYDNIETMFPHFPFVASLAERNEAIYVSKSKIIRKSVNVGYSTFRFLTGWAQSCRKIADVRLRRKALSEVFGKPLLLNLLYCILTERAFRPQHYRAEYRELLAQSFVARFFLGLKIAAFAPLVFMPNVLHRFCWSKYRDYRERNGLPLPNFDEAR